jgi:ribosome maturation factor RimP
MIDKTYIEQILIEYLKDSPYFLVELRVSSSNKISVFLDGDQGIPISECVKISRHIESLLDREKQDFELEVSSVGVDKPLKLLRQYTKNIGRSIQLTTFDGVKITGKLVDANDKGITLEKELKKKKKKDQHQEDLIESYEFSRLQEVKVLVSFKSQVRNDK